MIDEQIPSNETCAIVGREPKTIKRYTNRKLYDTVESRYVTLDEIAYMIRSGAEVRIVDNRTKEDLTSITLAQIIFAQEKKTSKTSLRTLRELILQGGERAQPFVEEKHTEILGREELAHQAAEQMVQGLFSRGPLTADRSKDLGLASQEAALQLQRKLDERVRSAIEGMAHVSETRRELSEISARMDEIEKRLQELER
jgi:polyhydroxyalkanoate synthesis repressor PhaR